MLNIQIFMLFLNGVGTQIFEFIKTGFTPNDIYSPADIQRYFKRKLAGNAIQKEADDMRLTKRGEVRRVYPEKMSLFIFLVFKNLFRFVKNLYGSLASVIRHNFALFKTCTDFMRENIQKEPAEIALFGIGDAAKTLILISRKNKIPIVKICDTVGGLKFFGCFVKHYSELQGFGGKILVSSAVNPEEKVEKLKWLGILEKNIIVLGRKE